MVPVSLSAVYRFDYYLVNDDFPLVPHAKLGLDWAYWQITDGNGEIATDSVGGHARGGTFGWHAALGLALVHRQARSRRGEGVRHRDGREPHRAGVRVRALRHLGAVGVGPAARRRHDLDPRACCSSFENRAGVYDLRRGWGRIGAGTGRHEKPPHPDRVRRHGLSRLAAPARACARCRAASRRRSRAMTGETVSIRGAGRTDAGRARRRPGRDLRARGAHPRDGAAARAELAPAARHRDPRGARGGARASTRASRRAARSTATRSGTTWSARRCTRAPRWHVRSVLDMAAMREAARALCGEHDFRAFRASDCERRTTVRVVRRLDVERQGALLTVEVEATAFLKNMVRILVGTLVDLGRGQITADAIDAHAAHRRPHGRRHHRAAAGVDAAARDVLAAESELTPAAGPARRVAPARIGLRHRQDLRAHPLEQGVAIVVGQPRRRDRLADLDVDRSRVDPACSRAASPRGCRGSRTGRCRRPRRSPGESPPFLNGPSAPSRVRVPSGKISTE